MSTERECIIITGSSGLLGHALSHHFGEQDHTVLGFDREGPPYPPPNTETIFCDLTSDESVQKTMFLVESRYGSRIKAVFHLAAYYSFDGENSHMYKDLTLKGTERMLRELENFEVKQFIFSSSMLAYKPNDKGRRLTEDSELGGTWAYPQSKVDTEKLLQEKHGKIPVVVLRIAGVYSNICQSIPLAHQIQRIYERSIEGHMYSGDIHVKQSFVHLEDVVDAFDACIRNADKLPPYSVFNISEANTMSYQDIQTEVANVLFNEPWKTIEVPKPIAKAGAWVEQQLPLPEKPFIRPWMIDRASDNYEMDSTRAERVLGWKAKHSLRETLPLMLEGLKVDPEKWYELNKLKPVPQNPHNEEVADGGSQNLHLNGTSRNHSEWERETQPQNTDAESNKKNRVA